jgi:hypothetical protein
MWRHGWLRGKRVALCLVSLTTIWQLLAVNTGVLAAATTQTSVRVNTGRAYTDYSGNAWSAPTGFSAGNTRKTSAYIAGTRDQQLYTTERYGNFTFTAQVPNGDYTVTLKFAEIHWSSAGKRVFNVSINGTQVLHDFDILTEVPPNTALDKTVPVSVANGTVTITFQTVVDNAKVSSLQIIPAISGTPTPTATRTSTPAPTATLTPTSTPPSGSRFVTVCGTGLCLNGQSWRVRGATAYGQYGNATNEVALATQANLNSLELVEFDDQYHVLSDVESSATWTRVDQFLAAARQGGIHVTLNLSEYGQSLVAAGYTATSVDWLPYLSFIANRVNSATGVRYADDPTIAMVELWGEIPAPAYGSAGAGTTQQMSDFFSRSLAQWKSLAPSILVSSGGFSHLNDPNSGIPWKTIMADPNNATCDIEINSTDDLNTSVSLVSQYCQSIGKPWFLAAWSSCWGASRGSWDLDYWPDDQSMATHAQAIASVSNGTSPGTIASLGDDFWNLASTSPVYGQTCDIGPQFPLTFAAVQQR